MNTRAVLIGFAVIAGIAATGAVMQYQQGFVDYERMLSTIGSALSMFILVWFATVCIKRPIVLLYAVLIGIGSAWFGLAASLLTAALVAALMAIMTKLNKGE